MLQVKANRAESKRIKADFILRGSLKEPLIPVQDLNTILGNLLDNAIEAVEDSLGPKEIKAGVISREDKLLITVENTGSKLPEQVLQRIFQPGFTTKTYGQGMGLWSIKKIVDSYGGSIEVKNEEKGIRFEISFRSSNS